MTDQVILQLIQVLSLYCGLQGSGIGVEYTKYGTWNGDLDRSGQCFAKIWKCAHKVTDSNAMVAEAHNCITKHVNGELK